MHIVNHPKIEVLAQLAQLGAKQAGLSGALAPPEGVPDRLARCQTWPVYPELARRLGVPGSLTFTGGPPDDADFAYFAFGIGMTFQVPDVKVTCREMRRSVLFHQIISFAYNTTILALIINLVAGRI